MRTLFVVNPISGNGRTGRKWERFHPFLKENFPVPFDVVFTQYPCHATELVRNALRSGFEKIISVGGDGTLNEVVNGFWENEKLVHPRAVLGVLQMGTGCDFTRTIEMPRNWETAVAVIAKGSPRPIDVGYAIFTSLRGETISRYFINIMDFGIGGAVVERVNRTTKMFGGKVSFLIGIISTLFQYRNKTIRFALNGGSWQKQRLNNFIIANGQYFGGGLNPAPHALLDDGLFDIILFGDVSRIEAMKNLSNLRKGTHLQHPKIEEMRATHIKATSEEDVYIDMDGEFAGKLPTEVKILPGILNFIFP